MTPRPLPRLAPSASGDLPRSPRPTTVWVLLALVLFVALALRWQQTTWTLPYLHHWDEPTLAFKSLEMLQKGDLHPHFFNYGTLPIYMAAAVDAVVLMKLAALPEDHPQSAVSLGDVATQGAGGWPWELSHPDFLLWNRRTTVLFGLGTLVLAFLFARALVSSIRGGETETRETRREGERAGLLAAAFLAVLPFHIEHSALLTVDVPASFFALLALWASGSAWRQQRFAPLVWSAASVGLAIACKYNTAIYLLAPLGVGLGLWAKSPRSEHLGRIAALPAVAIVMFFLAMPYALLDAREFLDGAAYEVHHYAVRGSGPSMDAEPGWPHLRLDLELLALNLGPVAGLLAVVGLLQSLGRPLGFVYFALPLLQLYLTSLSRPAFHRNLVILYPMASVAMAVAVITLHGWLSGRLPAKQRRLVGSLVSLLVLVGLLVRASEAERRVDWSTRPDTRSLAVDHAIRAAEASGLRLGIASELRLHRLDLARLPGDSAVRPTLELLCQPQGEQLLLLADVHESRRPEVSSRLDRLVEAAGPPIRRFGEPSYPVHLERYSTRPAVAWKRAPEPTGGVPLACGDGDGGGGIDPDLLELEGPSARYPRSLGLPPGSAATTPPFVFAAGSARFALHALPPPGAEAVEVEVTAWEVCGDDCRRRLDRRRFELAPRARAVSMELELPSAATIRFETRVVPSSPVGALIRGQWVASGHRR